MICEAFLSFRYSAATNGPKRSAIYAGAEIRKQAFLATVDSYNADARRHGNVEMDIRADHTWEDVLSMQQRVCTERYAANSKGHKSFWQTKIRKFSDNSESFKSWLKLLPKESHYLSVLCGGLTLILEASSVMWYTFGIKQLTLIRPQTECPRSAKVSGTPLMRFHSPCQKQGSTLTSSPIRPSCINVMRTFTLRYWIHWMLSSENTRNTWLVSDTFYYNYAQDNNF